MIDINELGKGLNPKERIKAIVKHYGLKTRRFYKLPDEWIWEDFSYCFHGKNNYSWGLWSDDPESDENRDGYETIEEAQTGLIRFLQGELK